MDLFFRVGGLISPCRWTFLTVIYKRVKVFHPVYKIDYETFETLIDLEGRVLLDEDFTDTIRLFRDWCLGQEKSLQDLFLI